MIKTIFFTFLLLPFLSFTQDWPIYNQDWYDRNLKDWPSDYKDLNDTCDVIPLGVDFGFCSMALGWALTDSGLSLIHI